MFKIIVNKINLFRNIFYRNLEREFKCFIKIPATIPAPIKIASARVRQVQFYKGVNFNWFH